MAGSREAAVPGEQCGAKILGERYVGGIVGREIVAKPPDSRQQQKVGITSHPQVAQIVDGLVGALR